MTSTYNFKHLLFCIHLFHPWPKSLAKNYTPTSVFFFSSPFHPHRIFRFKWENVRELSLDSIKVTDATFSGLLRDLQTMD